MKKLVPPATLLFGVLIFAVVIAFVYLHNKKIQDQADQLVSQSNLDYGQISDVNFAEVQVIPSLNSLPTLKPNELFVPILMYHHIDVNPRPTDPLWASLFVTPGQLDAQIQYLKTNGYSVVTLDDLYDAMINGKTLPKKAIVLTFDDGYRSFYDNAYQILKKYNVKATEFVITDVQTAPAYLTWDEIIEMDKSGLVQFGAHTRHHPFLTKLSQTAEVDEIFGSKNDLEAHLNKAITWFAYPYGDYNASVLQITKNAGFKGAVSTVYGAGQSSEKLYFLPRIMVDGRYNMSEFVARISE